MLTKFQDLRVALVKEFDRQIEKISDRRNLIAEAIRQKMKLKKYKVGFWRSLYHTKIRYLISMPFIYMMIVPALIMHFFLEIYHQICFRLYEIPLVRARDYFVFDRKHLAYLNWFERFNCCYCSYFNGVAAYTREIAGRTERYWCPIKHAKTRRDPHDHYEEFVEYLDGETYHKKKKELRKFKGVKK